MTDIPWEDYERLRMTLQSIIRAAKQADDSRLRGYVLGITGPLRRQLAAEEGSDRTVAEQAQGDGPHQSGPGPLIGSTG